MKTKPSIATLTCYRQPDYVRTASLRQGLRDSGLFEEVIVVKNTSTGVKRYLEFLSGFLKVRFTKNPDYYMVTFRAYEILPLVLLFTIGKKVIYDELINPYEWFVYEHHWFKDESIVAKLLRFGYRFMGKRTMSILADTPSHAELSAQLMDLPIEKYKYIPVSTDETMFTPKPMTPHDGFRVFYYGSLLPLHGVPTVLEAARLLKDEDIIIQLVGGKQDMADLVKLANDDGAHVEYTDWIEYTKIPNTIAMSDLCLAGPFGDTLQARYVVTGKAYQFMASERPIVVGENLESHIFEDEKDALIVKQLDAKALAEKILWAKNNPEKLAKIAKNGRKLYEKEFSNKRVAEDLRALFISNGITDVKR